MYIAKCNIVIDTYLSQKREHDIEHMCVKQ